MRPHKVSYKVSLKATAGWIKMPLGMEEDLAPSDFVLDRDPAPSPQKRYLLFSLPLQVQPPNVQLKLLHTNSQTIPLMVHKPLANGSPAIVLALLQQATKTILINLAAGPSKHGKRSLDFLGLPGLILRSQRAMRSSRCTWTQEMAAHQSQNITILLANRYD